MTKSNNKKKRTDGTIPMKNKSVAVPSNIANASTSLTNNANRDEVATVIKGKQMY
ncbi:hypothetical protein R0131_07625 [Clostridium sp. AL.422]|uniref:hypothetical protein n=1 Tax=Clostridium TaxID=1485 RepID=UPI00293DFB04|nr:MULTISPECIES: hypothetical protein [unclassified Clostridium]MDV4150704.1 hypothetical protein [Clostridium sp. AL.422]